MSKTPTIPSNLSLGITIYKHSFRAAQEGPATQKAQPRQLRKSLPFQISGGGWL
jgi:hypothetical protein